MPADHDGTERELKLGLPDEAAWHAVRALAGPGEVVEQTNLFLSDPAGQLDRAQIAARLRHEHAASDHATPRDRHRLTVKGPEAAPAATNGPGFLSRRAELEAPLDAVGFEEARAHGLRLRPWIEGWRRTALSAEGRDLVDRLDRDLADLPLHPWTGFRNRRETIPLTLPDPTGPLRIRLEVDRTELPGGRIDHELEVEAESDAELARVERALRAWLDTRLGLRPAPIASKLARLVEALRDSGRPGGLGEAGPDAPTAAARRPPARSKR